MVGNPIVLSTGVKQQIDVDYRNASGTLQFVRTYRSDTRKWANNYEYFGGSMAQAPFLAPAPLFYRDAGKFGEYDYMYTYRGVVNDVAVRRANGRMLYFSSGGNYMPSANINDRIFPVLEDGSETRWKVVNADTGETEEYDLYGNILKLTEPYGNVTKFYYSNKSTPPEIAQKPGLLLRVVDVFGREMNFIYDLDHNLRSMIDPAGREFLYAYQGKTLTSVTYPDGTQRVYSYNEAGKTDNVTRPYALTGITDENGVRFSTYTYDGSGRASSTEHAGGVEKYQLSYPYPTMTIVTDPLGVVRKYNILPKLGVPAVVGTIVPGPDGIGTVTTSNSYDINGNMVSSSEVNGAITTFSYDLARNLETGRTEASGTALARTTTTEWHPTFRLPLRLAEPKRITTFSYDAVGKILGKSVQSTTDANGVSGFSAATTGMARSWAYTYTEFGKISTIKGPRTDVNDITTYTYDSEGNLATLTNAAGHITTFSDYDRHGNVGRITDPNGLATNLSYTSRGWLASRSVGGETTNYSYDSVGQLKQVTLPDQSTMSFNYDDARRLTSVVDSLGNKVSYTLDNMGKRLLDQISDPAGTLTRQISRVYNILSLLKQETGGAQ